MRSLAANGEGVGISYTLPPGDLSYDGAQVAAVSISDPVALEPVILARTGGMAETPVVAVASAAILEMFGHASNPADRARRTRQTARLRDLDCPNPLRPDARARAFLMTNQSCMDPPSSMVFGGSGSYARIFYPRGFWQSMNPSTQRPNKENEHHCETDGHDEPAQDCRILNASCESSAEVATDSASNTDDDEAAPVDQAGDCIGENRNHR